MDRITAERRAPFGGSPDVGERGRRTQQRILAAATQVFAEVGYQAARIDAITERAECSRPTFYQYFSSKEELFNRLGGLLGASLVELTEAFPGIGRPGAEGGAADDELTAWVAALGTLHHEWAPVFVSFRPALRGDAALTAGAADLTRRYGKALDRSLPDEGGDVDPELVAALVMTMLTGALSLRSGGAGGTAPIGGDVDDEAVADQLASVVRRSLAAGHEPAAGAAPAPDSATTQLGAGPSRSAGVEGDLEGAALVVFPRLGLEGTRVDDLVAEVEVAHGTFYRYFSDKEELFERVAGRAAADMLELLADLPAAVDDGRLDAWSGAWFATYLAHGAILSVWAEAPPSEEGFSEASAAAALDLLGPAVARAGGADGPLVALAVLSLIEWSPYLVQQFDGFDHEPTRRAVAVILGRLLAPDARDGRS